MIESGCFVDQLLVEVVDFNGARSEDSELVRVYITCEVVLGKLRVAIGCSRNHLIEDVEIALVTRHMHHSGLLQKISLNIGTVYVSELREPAVRVLAEAR